MKEAIKKILLGFGILWLCIWAMAVDTPGDKGLIAIIMALAGMIIMAGVMLWEYLEMVKDE